jgi:hypothetical protein
VAVQNPPSTSAPWRSVSIDHNIVLVCAQILSAPIPAMISEVTMEFTKLAAFSNFPHTVECKKNECAYKILVHNISAEISSNHMK